MIYPDDRERESVCVGTYLLLIYVVEGEREKTLYIDSASFFMINKKILANVRKFPSISDKEEEETKR